MLRKENMLRKCLVCVMTRDYPSICLNYNFLETAKKGHITCTKTQNKSTNTYVREAILPAEALKTLINYIR